MRLPACASAGAALQAELDFLRIESSPAFVRAPEGNGYAGRFIRTLKEQLLWVPTFETAEDLRLALHAWLDVYNERWLIERTAIALLADRDFGLTRARRGPGPVSALWLPSSRALS